MHRRTFVSLGTKAALGMALSSAFAQENPFHFPDDPYNRKYKKELAFINRIRDEAIKLGFRLDNGFYKAWATDKQAYNYCLFISPPEKIARLPDVTYYINFGQDVKAAAEAEQQYQGAGIQTHMYRTAGMANTQLSVPLLEFDYVSLAYVTLHEACHQHIRSQKIYMPYSFEEACADAAASVGVQHFAQQYNDFSLGQANDLIRRETDIYQTGLQAADDFEKGNYKDKEELYKKCRNDILKHIPSGHRFLSLRYDYKVNNAYLLRCRLYGLHYELFKSVASLMGIKDFLKYILTLRPDEAETLKRLKSITG